jgi:hypothetical protein
MLPAARREAATVTRMLYRDDAAHPQSVRAYRGASQLQSGTAPKTLTEKAIFRDAYRRRRCIVHRAISRNARLLHPHKAAAPTVRHRGSYGPIGGHAPRSGAGAVCSGSPVSRSLMGRVNSCGLKYVRLSSNHAL